MDRLNESVVMVMTNPGRPRDPRDLIKIGWRCRSFYVEAIANEAARLDITQTDALDIVMSIGMPGLIGLNQNDARLLLDSAILAGATS